MRTAATYLMGLVMVAGQPGCAHYRLNPPLGRFDPKAGYRLSNLPASETNSDGLFVVLAIGGGGKRSAAVAYGVLRQLRDTTVVIDGRRRRLLDEVDLISGDSGGSFLAAYYALFGDEVFVRFEDEFLKRDVETDLLLEFLAPWNSVRMLSPTFDRGDVAMEHFNRTLFRRKTYGDLVKARRRPFLFHQRYGHDGPGAVLIHAGHVRPALLGSFGGAGGTGGNGFFVRPGALYPYDAPQLHRPAGL